MSHLLSLPSELFHLILNHFTQKYLSTLLSLGLSCKCAYNLTLHNIQKLKSLPTLLDFEILSCIGKGNRKKHSALVFQVRFKKDGKIYALKQYSKKGKMEDEDLGEVLRMGKVLKQVRHDLIPKTYFAFQTDASLYLVTDFLNGGELFEHLQPVKTFSKERTRQYIVEMVSVCLYLHSKFIVIQNSGLEDFVLDAEGHCYLVDMDHARTVKDYVKTRFFYDTVYLPPETLRGESLSLKLDWWILGTIFYECLVGSPPFYNPNNGKMYQSILEDDLRMPENWDEDTKSLVQGMLEKRPEARFGDEEVRNHPFFHGVDWEKVANKQWEEPVWKPFVDDQGDPCSDLQQIESKWKMIKFSDCPNQGHIVEVEEIFREWEYKYC